MNRKHLPLILLFLFCCSSLTAQEAWDLKRCLEYARETNLTLKARRLDQATSIIGVKQSEAAFLPNLNFGAGGGWRFGRSINPFTNDFEDRRITSFDMGANGSLPLFQGFTRTNTLQQAKMDQEIASYNLADAENTVGLNVATAYLNILLNREILQQNEYQVTSIKEQRDRTEKLVNAGTLARTGLLELEAQLATNETNVVNARNLLQMAYLTLQQLLNLDPSPNFDVEVPDLPPVGSEFIAESVEATYDFAEGSQPNIIGSDLNVKSAEKGIEIAKGQGMPSLNFNYNIGTGYSQVDNDLIEQLEFNEQMENNLGYSFNLGLNIPIYNRRSIRSGVERAEILHKQAELNAFVQRQTLRQTIEQAYLDLQSAFTQYQQVERQISSLQLAFDNAQKQFDLGVINSVDYLLAQNNLQAALLDRIQLKYQYHFRLKVLDFYNGKSLEFE